MIDFLLAWGAAKTAGFIFKPVLEELAIDATKGWVKDIFKNSLKTVLKLPTPDPLTIAAGGALKEFLQLIQNELADNEFSDEEIKKYEMSVKHFIKDKTIKENLGMAFNINCKFIDSGILSKQWSDSNLKPLPDDFDWDHVSKSYLRKVRNIRRSSNELREILDSEILYSIEQHIEENTPIVPGFDLKSYQLNIKEEYSDLKLDILDTSGFMYRDLKLWDIFIPQNIREADEFVPQQYEFPKNHQKRQGNEKRNALDSCRDGPSHYKQHYHSQPVYSVFDVINNDKYKHMMLLGDPGSGKSSLLKYLTLQWAQRPTKELPLYPLPIFIELRTYFRNLAFGYCMNFLDYLHSGSGILTHLNKHELHERLKKGNVVAMFDGLDEIFDPSRRKTIIVDILRFTKDYPKVKVIVTSRLFGHKYEWFGNSDFHYFILQDLQPNQIYDFIVSWHDLNFIDQEERAIKAERLFRAIEKSPSIAELAGNPLLLTLMAILNRNQDLPNARVELYKQASRVLLELWDAERDLKTDQMLFLDYKDKREILRKVAYRMQTNEKQFKGNVIHVDELERIILNFLKSIEVTNPRQISRSLIHQLRLRNFILCNIGQNYYAFVHRTFLEYFCASEIFSRFERRGLSDGLELDRLKYNVFGKHWSDHSWHEVLRLITGMIDARFAGNLINFLLDQSNNKDEFLNIFLATSCFSEVRERGKITSVSDKLLDKLKYLVKFDFNFDYKPYSREANSVSEIRIKAVKAISDTWAKSHDIRLWIKDRALNDDDFTVRQIALREMSLKWKELPDTFNTLKLLCRHGPYWTIRQAAVQELSKYWNDEDDTKEILENLTRHDEDPLVRKVALQELSKNYKNDSDVKDILKEIVKGDCDSAVRYAAVKNISKSFCNDSDIKPWLLKNAKHSDHWAVRQSALQELSKWWKEDIEILHILKELAQTDTSWSVRQAAVRELSNRLSEDPENMLIIENLIISDDHHEVRQIAVQELSQKQHNDKKVLSILKKRLKTDPHEAVRQTIVKELSYWLRNDSETLSIIKELVESDNHWSVREIAIKELSRNCTASREMLNILQNRAESDPWWRVRKTAVQEMAEFFNNYPETTVIIAGRAESDEDSEVRNAAQHELSRCCE
jgi:energy-coupling factor transporter ATP-binding protein EcfA2